MMPSIQHAVQRIEELKSRLSLDNEVNHFKIDGVARERIYQADGDGYHYIAACSVVLNKGNRHALELGTYFGTSAMCLHRGSTTVTTVDIDWTPLICRLFDGNFLELDGSNIPHPGAVNSLYPY